jgi:hypothetical protein
MGVFHVNNNYERYDPPSCGEPSADG